MPGVSIDRLTLEVPGWPETAARRLASMVADRLAAGGLGSVRADVGTLRVDLPASHGVQPDRLASHIVSEILRQMQRSP
jgi:hypothetical protein